VGRLFGTDGVRGVANQELTPELAFGLGQAVGSYFRKNKKGSARILIGKDTRVSGEMLEAALAAGIASVGVDVVRLGIIPTPGVAYLCRKLQADAGAMISASHNPVEDNGIKFFDGAGFKLSDAAEDELEEIYHHKRATLERPVGTAVGRIFDEPEAIRHYEEYLVATAPNRFEGLRIVVDCGFGAAYQLAPAVLRRLGAVVIPLHDMNDGARINVKCGSTHPEILQKEVVASGADLGIAHDGDADRLIAVDEAGRIVDGDQIMAVCGLELQRTGKLKHDKIAVTVYSNLGLIQTFKKQGIEAIVTANGDRYVLEAMRKGGLALGGEQSGHIIFLEHNSTGDGILTALQLIATVAVSGRKLSQLAAQMSRFPQVLENVKVTKKDGWEKSAAIQEAIEQITRELGEEGRVLVRASGTEPLIRVMAEGPDEGRLRELVGSVVAVIHRELG
jgi:phosphoglucosamine mutase